MTTKELSEKIYKTVTIDAEYDHAILVKIEDIVSEAVGDAVFEAVVATVNQCYSERDTELQRMKEIHTDELREAVKNWQKKALDKQPNP